MPFTAGDPTIAWSDGPVEAGQCGEDNAWQWGSSLDEPRLTHTVPQADTVPASLDPSFWHTVLFIEFVDDPATPCLQRIVASAELEWDVPITRPWVQPVDAGASAEASGEVRQRKGQIVGYLTDAGDTWDGIARRFGLSGDDLRWLNPLRLGGSGWDATFADQPLNLDPAHRGGSESRRFS